MGEQFEVSLARAEIELIWAMTEQVGVAGPTLDLAFGLRQKLAKLRVSEEADDGEGPTA